MVSQDVIAQLRQDITTAEDAGDEAAAARLRADLDAATRTAQPQRDTTDETVAAGLAGVAAAPQPADNTVRQPAEDLGPGSYDGSVDPETNIPGSTPEGVQEPPD
ncbi:hypothetical protein [Nocardia goodfellowii]|uniref:Uncharacterized protein n=1 Tax=Nocardia goodfellowii TaxID=882446 RepID=A0ABS4QMH5_9NOCA|nr:hypothetical protein [Nocardia goodfellowii]MBP2191861.1 hypothetical protein [Nocardia goodfellowii]